MIYPNLMRLDYDNLRTREDQEITAPERAESITPLEHFSAFYQQMCIRDRCRPMRRSRYFATSARSSFRPALEV